VRPEQGGVKPPDDEPKPVGFLVGLIGALARWYSLMGRLGVQPRKAHEDATGAAIPAATEPCNTQPAETRCCTSELISNARTRGRGGLADVTGAVVSQMVPDDGFARLHIAPSRPQG
jgi:hypothetical protein